LYSRNGISLAEKYPEVADALRAIKKKLILDGEVVAFDEQGNPSFQYLQHFAQSENTTLQYYVFDILQSGTKDTTHLPLIERKALLEEVLPVGDIIKYSEHVLHDGKALLKEVIKMDMEGIIAKNIHSLYHPGVRTGDWLKIRNHNIAEALVAGYTPPSGSRKYFGSIVLANYKRGKLKYAGNVGTGFKDKTLKELYDYMQKLRTEDSPFAESIDAGDTVTWVKPELVANIKYSEITNEGKFRHPVFMGLRIDKSAKDLKQS
jgi:bifunctional non-homologous end joining protein LigD